MKMTPEQEAAYAADYGTDRGDLFEAAPSRPGVGCLRSFRLST